MAQPGRKSAAELAVFPRVDGQPARLQPPSGLDETEARIFAELAAGVDARHFTSTDMPLIVTYVQAVAQNARAVRHLHEEGDVIGGKPSPWVLVRREAVMAMSTMSMRLRLSPQARREKARPPQGPISYYDLMALREADDGGVDPS
jgi:phage terminase small subunit